MNIKSLQDILPLIEKPSSYLGSEINSIKKDLTRVKLHFALAFPDLYEIGMSHFGLQILYHILNSHEDIAAERVFAPGVDMEAYLKSSGIPLMSLEAHKPLNDFNILGFSLLYELNFTNILTMLELAKIPFFSAQRDLSWPIIIAGGPCTCNPEPVADFFDAIVIGDGEKVIMELAKSWITWKENYKQDKEALLKIWSDIEGVYIPAFYKPEFDQNGFQTLFPQTSNAHSSHNTVKRAVLKNIDKGPFPDAPVIPFGKPVHDRLRLEVARGCTRGCRFCQAGMIYRPVREQSMDSLLNLAEASIAATGYEDISLLSLSTGDYGSIVSLMAHLMARCESRHIAVSLPSIRAGTLTPELMKLIKRVRKTGFTIAPEAGSQRLRDVINKNITDREIIDTVKDAFHLGWQVIKLYFMIGLPSETDADLQSIVDIVKELKKIKGPRRRKNKINISVATFIPKPHTPFQWASQIPLGESKEKIRWLRNHLKIPGIHFKWQNPEVSIVEGLWARGDRRLSRLLVAAYKMGCKFDGWSDSFQYDLWERAFSEANLDIDFYTTRNRDITEPLPWDHINTKVTKDFLIKEWKKSAWAEHTPDCRLGGCNNCGVCDFDCIAPMVFKSPTETVIQTAQADNPPELFFHRLKFSYSKRNQAKYFGHLELVNIFLRALRRTKTPVKFSEGFHPMPRISFQDPLPIGVESINESFFLTVPDHVKPQMIIKILNGFLPEGLTVHDCQVTPEKPVQGTSKSATYLVKIKDAFFSEKELKRFQKNNEVMIRRTNRKGRLKKIDLKDMIIKMDILDPCTLKITLKSEPGKTVRPFEAITHIFNLPDIIIKQAVVVKEI